MLAAARGIIHGNTVIIEDDMRKYDGAEVVVTVLNYPSKEEPVNENDLVISGESAKKASDIEKAVQSLLGAVPYTEMSLSELREERLRKYETTD